MHTRQAQIAHTLSVADPTNSDLQTIEAFAWLGIATVLSKQGATREALGRQTQAIKTLRALFEADTKNTDARYNAAFALSEAGESLITLGQFAAATRNLRDALGILEPLVDGDEPARTSAARALRDMDNSRLGKIDARHSNQVAGTQP
jgi:tetratricopeptide (TPR) repeat protein